jgi:hypothetical protein
VSAVHLSLGVARGAHEPAALLWVEVLNCRLDGVCSSLPPSQRWRCSPLGATVLLRWKESRDGCCDDVTFRSRGGCELWLRVSRRRESAARGRG